MTYGFGEILDARTAPGIEHFILSVGEISRADKTEVMYYVITSRVYAVFRSILSYFNDCLSRGDKYFLRHFAKEKVKKAIKPHGFLSQAIFFDKDKDYSLCLDVDSMVVVNSDPLLIDKTVLESFKKDGKVLFMTRLAKLDGLKLMQTIKLSDDVSPDKRSKILGGLSL